MIGLRIEEKGMRTRAPGTAKCAFFVPKAGNLTNSLLNVDFFLAYIKKKLYLCTIFNNCKFVENIEQQRLSNDSTDR